jgi:hypothetical protein
MRERRQSILKRGGVDNAIEPLAEVGRVGWRNVKVVVWWSFFSPINSGAIRGQLRSMNAQVQLHVESSQLNQREEKDRT